MILSKIEKPIEEEMELAKQCQEEAEQLYRSGRSNCAEAVLAVIRKYYRADLPEEVVQMVGGFGKGSGAGCICGAVSGGTVALAMVLKDDKKQISHLTRELHLWFKEKYGVTCCKIIQTNHKGACPVLTGEVAGKISEMLSRR